MSKVNSQVDVDKGRVVCELLVRPSLEYAAEVSEQETVVHAGCLSCHR